MSEPPTNDDATWNEIVANYGDRAPLEPEVVEVEPRVFWTPDNDPGHYEPPPPPPAPMPKGLRGAAWIGLTLAPVAILLAALLRISVPEWFFGLLGVAFVASMGYLVATMKTKTADDVDPWDDGSRV